MRKKPPRQPETALYAPVKSYLEAQGFTVKAEVHGCDVVAHRQGEAPVVVELKSGLTLQLFYQAIDRLSLTEDVYVAVPRPKGGVPVEAVKLCRRIGAGLLCVAASGSVDVLAHPTPYSPRKNSKRLGRLLGEFHRREGDGNVGGSTGRKIMTAYRQDAEKCRAFLQRNGPTSPRVIKDGTGVERAANILRDNHYGWFCRIERGIYGLTDSGPPNP